MRHTLSIVLSLALLLPVACAKKATPAVASKTAAAGLPPGHPALPPGHPVVRMPGTGVPNVKPPADLKVPPADAAKTPDGIATVVLEKGTGATHPGPNDVAVLDLNGWTSNGQLVVSSAMHHGPLTLPLNHTPTGLRESVQLMVEGEKMRAWIPASVVRPGRPGGVSLVFDIKLISFKPGPKPLPIPPVPTDVKAPPKSATKAADGLAWKVLRMGTGTVHPGPTSVVQVHYAGWTTDGKMFDSSYGRGVPATFPLNGVIPGWTEGLQHMVEGEKTRFWIPEALAYKGHPGAPQGMLVFDVELLKIVKQNGMPMMPHGIMRTVPKK